MTEDLFYLQDSRSYVGNDVMFWALDGKGYTTDLRRAQTYTREEAQRMHNSRPTDIPWAKSYIDGKTRPAVDMQYIRRDDGVTGAGIDLVVPPKPTPKRERCATCGSFIKSPFIQDCQKCGADNRP